MLGGGNVAITHLLRVNYSTTAYARLEKPGLLTQGRNVRQGKMGRPPRMKKGAARDADERVGGSTCATALYFAGLAVNPARGHVSVLHNTYGTPSALWLSPRSAKIALGRTRGAV